MQIRLLEKRGNQRRLQRSGARDSQGWSLVATLAMMIVISIFISAMYGALLPAYLHVVNLQYKDSARCANEAAVDDVLNQINFTPGAIPLPALGGAPTTAATDIVAGGVTYHAVTTISNKTLNPPKNCIFNSPAAAYTAAFYLLQTQVSKGAMTRTLSVLLQPVPGDGVPGQDRNGYWKNGGIFSVGCTSEIGLACVGGYNLPAGWNNPYQFADTTVAQGITWQIGNGDTNRSQVIAGNQLEFWHPGDSPPQMPPNTIGLTYEPFTQIMGNVYSNYQVQSGAQGNGYWMRNHLSDYSGGANVKNGNTANANVFGAQNGMKDGNNQGVPTGYECSNNNYSVPMPTSWTAPAQPAHGGSLVNTSWGFNAKSGGGSQSDTIANMPTAFSTDGGAVFQANPYTGGYITAPGPGTAGAFWTGKETQFDFPAPTVYQAPGAPVGTPAPATGGLGVPNATGTYFSSAPQAVVINGNNAILKITNNATTVPPSLSVPANTTVEIPPGNYNLSSLQVLNGGQVQIDPAVLGQTQFFLSVPGTGQGTNGAVYVDNTSSINMTGINVVNGAPATGFNNSKANDSHTSPGTQGFGDALPTGQSAVDYGANKIIESSGSCFNLVLISNSSCNMLFGGNTRALINAPNANVNIGYQPNNNYNYCSNTHSDPTQRMANNANFYGAIIANNTNVISAYDSAGGAYMHYDVKLKLAHQPDANTPVQFTDPLVWYDPWMFGTPAGGGAGGGGGGNNSGKYRAVSWQEQLGAW